MKRRLIIMRHAKSDWKTDAPTDHLRPLNARGRRDAPRVAAAIVQRDWLPELVLSSDSRRTTETWELMAPEFGSDTSIEFQSALYHSGMREITSFTGMVPTDIKTLMMLGHNPGWQQSVEILSGEYIEMTTANAALLEIENDEEALSWAAAIDRQGKWTLVDVIRPREI
ncbi:MAG: histidine phosphatase family protein [Planctomycetota bacterium]